MAEGGGEAEAGGARPGVADVFVSYASQDAALAHETVEVLEKHGISCWIAPRDVVGGAHYADAIITAITGARALVLVLSDHAMASKHVGKEVERASSKGRPIIALRTGAAPLPPAFEYFLSESQWIDVGAAGVSGAASKLTAAVRSHLAPAATAPVQIPGPAMTSPPKPVRRRNWMLAGGTAILALVLACVAVERFRSATPLTGHAAGAAMPAAAGHTGAATEKSIAVLPFVDMSEKHDQEYFSDGLSEELIDHLAHVPGLKVIARTSAFAFKGKNEDVRSIATKLGVSNVLEGSVRKAGNKLRIGAQLIRASDGAEVWSETYSRDLSDIFQLQDEISSTVANALNAALNVTLGEAQRSARGTANMEAYKLLLQGNYYFWRGYQDDNKRAAEAFRQAVQLDPQYALAWAKLARVYAWEALTGELVPSDAGSKGHDAVRRALAIDPNCAEAYFAQGNLARLVDGDWSGAKAAFDRAVALDPNGQNGADAKTNLLLLMGESNGQYDDYFAFAHQLLERNPLDTETYATLAGVLQGAGRFDDSAATFRKLLDINPKFATAYAQYALTLLFTGKNSEALEAAKQESDEPSKLTALACIYWALGRRPESDAALSALERKFADRSRYYIAGVHAYRGEADAAFRWLDLSYQESKGSVEILGFDPLFQKLHGDPRFAAVLRKAKLPAAH